MDVEVRVLLWAPQIIPKLLQLLYKMSLYLRNLAGGPLSGPLCQSVMRSGVFGHLLTLQIHPAPIKWFCLREPSERLKPYFVTVR